MQKNQNSHQSSRDRSSSSQSPHYANAILLLSLCLVLSLLSAPSSHSTAQRQRFYDGQHRKFACHGQVAISNSGDAYHVEFTPARTGKGHGYGGFALQNEHAVTPKTSFISNLRVDQAEFSPEKKLRAKLLLHVNCSDGEIWEICIETAMWSSYCSETFFDGVRTYRLDASSPPIIYLGYGHQPEEYVNRSYNVQDLFEQYLGTVKPLTITEVVFEAWTNNVNAFSEDETIDAYFKAGDVEETT